MKRLRIPLAAALLAGLLLVGDQALAGSFVAIGFRVAPPPPRRELVVVRPRSGHVWVHGHWAWRPRFGRYVWIGGGWVPARRGYVWVDGRWRNTPHGWVFIDGYWGR